MRVRNTREVVGEVLGEVVGEVLGSGHAGKVGGE